MAGVKRVHDMLAILTDEGQRAVDEMNNMTLLPNRAGDQERKLNYWKARAEQAEAQVARLRQAITIYLDCCKDDCQPACTGCMKSMHAALIETAPKEADNG